MSWDQPVQKGFLVNLNNRQRLTFQYNPKEFTDEKGLVLATLQVPGLNKPHYQYVSGQARRISFKLELFKERVKEHVAWLQSLVNPVDGAPPPHVLLVVGDLYPGLRCVVRHVKVHYFDHFVPENMAPQRAWVDIHLEEKG